MELAFSRHALRRMDERVIGFTEILQCLYDPDKIEKNNGKEVKFYKLISKDVLILVCSIKENQCKIITVIKSSKIEKYL
ncbi:MAG: DUF4258 domain-containing protein [Candidatus Gracilibacteria bacterium]|jgi:hypothetical protein